MVSEQAAMWWGGWPMGFYCHPSPFGLDFGTLDFGTWDLGLTIVNQDSSPRFCYQEHHTETTQSRNVKIELFLAARL